MTTPATKESVGLDALRRIKDSSKGPSRFVAERAFDRMQNLNSSDVLLGKVCDRLLHMAYDDLTTAERQIADLLIAAGWIKKDGNGELKQP